MTVMNVLPRCHPSTNVWVYASFSKSLSFFSPYQDHADSAERHHLAVFELLDWSELLPEPKRTKCVQPVGEVRPVLSTTNKCCCCGMTLNTHGHAHTELSFITNNQVNFYGKRVCVC